MPRVVCPVCRTGFEANISRDNFALNCVTCGVAFNASAYLSRQDFASNGSSGKSDSKFAPPAHDSTRTGGLPFMQESADAAAVGAPANGSNKEAELSPLPRRKLVVAHPLASQRPPSSAALSAVAAPPESDVLSKPPSVIGVPTPPPASPLKAESVSGAKPALASSPSAPQENPRPAPALVTPVPASQPAAVVKPPVKPPEAKLKKNRRPLLEGSFGPYDIEGEIARGGVGAVFKARERDGGRPVALKVLLDGEEAGEAERERFRHECETAKALALPGMVQVYAVGELEQRPYMAMELVNGRSLDKIIPEKTLCVNDCLVLMKSVAETIGALHEAGYVHRDLKPGNILIDEFGSPKVADFGLVKSLDEITRLTASGLVCGTPAYMAPEQARGDGKAIDPRSDVWALGAVLYEMLAARPPFQAENALRLMLKITKNQPTALRTLNLKVPRDVDEIVMRCLEKAPERRYANARALSMDIARFLNGEPLEQGTQPKVQQFVNVALRNPRALATLACAAGVLVLVIMAAKFVFKPKDPRALVASGYAILKNEATPAVERYTSAGKLFEDAAKLDPANGTAQLLLASCLGHQAFLGKTFDTAKFERAGTAMHRAAELDAQLLPYCHALMADFNRLMKRYDLEARELEETLKSLPNSLKYRYQLAMAYWWAGSQTNSPDYYSKALNEYRNILKMNPEDAHVRDNINKLQALAVNQSVARR